MGQELSMLRQWASGNCNLDYFKDPCVVPRLDPVNKTDGEITDALGHALDPGLLLPMVQFSGLPCVFALERTSPQVFAALSRLIEPIKASFMKLYVCGGCQRSTSLVRGSTTVHPENMSNTVERLDLGRQIDSIALPNLWEAVAPMPEQRSDATIMVLRGYLYVCGGQDGSGVLTSAARFDPCGMEWEVLPSMAEGRREAAGAALNSCVYVCGGANTSSPLNSAERFNPLHNAWETLPPMLRQRSGAVSAVLGGYLCVAGGGDGQQPLSSAERLVEDRWEVPSSDIQRHGVTNFVGPLVHGLDRQVLPSMSCRRIRAASVVIQEKWFVCGGGDGRHVLNSAEVLDLGGIWQGLQPMASPRWSCVAGVVAGCLYVCGGGDGASVLQSAERFDLASGSWEELPAMSCARWDATAVVADCLYVLGGTDESEALNSAERFNHQSGAWEVLPSMVQARCRGAAAILIG